MITNYTPDGCRYSIGKLVNAVYLVSENALKDIRIDNGDAYINSISESPIKLDCYGINLSEEESLDERYKFIHTLKFSVNGYANKDDFQGRYYVIVKDEEGTYWFVNPLFPVKVTYTYTLGYQQNHTDFSIATASNHPVLRLYGMSDADTYQCNGYFLDGIDALWLNEKKYTVHNGNSVKYTNGGFKTIEYNKSSAVFTETFDGENTRHQIDFDVLFSQYKSSWHYNLLEFKDNLYSAVFKTKDGKYALCGFSFGLQPSYTVSADDTIQNADKIQITLQDAHDVGDAIEFFDNIDYEYLPDKTWEYTSEYGGYECVGNGIAKYLLQKEVDALGNETGNYKALEGYSYRFPGLDIVDTFSEIVTFTSPECGGGGCSIESSFPSTLTFNNTGCQTYYVKADTDWSIEASNDYITVSPFSGEAGVSYSVNVCNSKTPQSTLYKSTLTFYYCDMSSSVEVDVVEYSGCFPQGVSYNISANGQTINVPSRCCIQSVRETTNVGVSFIIYNSYIQITVPENNTGRNRSSILLVTFCDGTSENITINQSNVFEKWEDSGNAFCIYADKYKKQYLWTGTTSSSYVITTTSRDVLVERNSQDCILHRWVNTYVTTCISENGLYNKYYMYKEQESLDGGISWGDVYPPQMVASGNPISTYSELSDCEEALGSRWVATGDKVCIDDGGGGGEVSGNKIQFFLERTSTTPYAAVSCDNTRILSDSDFADYNHNQTWKIVIGSCIDSVESGTMSLINYYMPREIVINNGVSEFEDYAFRNFGAYTKDLIIPDSVKRIGRQCFEGLYSEAGRMTGVKNGTLVIGSGIEYIGWLAFSLCDYLGSITIYATTPPEVAFGAFQVYEGEGCPIYVPAESVNAYRTSPTWVQYVNINRIQPIS